MTGRTRGDRGERWTTALERERGEKEGGAGGCWDDGTGCYRRRRNRLTSQRCHLHHVSSYLFKLSLSIKEGERVTEREAMRTARETDGEQLDLVRGKQQKVRRVVKVNTLAERFIYSSQSGCTCDIRLYDYRYTFWCVNSTNRCLLVCLSLHIDLSEAALHGLFIRCFSGLLSFALSLLLLLRQSVSALLPPGE